MSIIQVPHLSDHIVHVLLFKDVKNAAFLRQQLMQGNADFEYAFLDATKIISVNHVLAAVFRAVNDMLHGRLKSRNVHSEIVFSLSPNNNIADSFRRFGVLDTTTSLLAVKVLPKHDGTSDSLDPAIHLNSVVEGEQIEFDDSNLQRTADLAQVRKLYKLDAPGPAKPGKKKPNKPDIQMAMTQTNGTHDEFNDVQEMEAVILGIMALKGS